MSAAAGQNNRSRSVTAIQLVSEVLKSDLSRELKFTAVTMLSFANPDGTQIRPALETVAKITRKSRRAVRADVAELVALGVLVPDAPRTRGGSGRPIVYRFDATVLTPLDLEPKRRRVGSALPTHAKREAALGRNWTSDGVGSGLPTGSEVGFLTTYPIPIP
jgi:hypothetical protein